MTFREALQEGSRRLEAAGTATPYLDALVLLSEATQVRKEQLYAALTDPLPAQAFLSYRRLVDERSSGMPVAYLTKRKEFYGREFYVDERVLIPRPDTEILVDTALEIADRDPLIRRVHDLGTGSGCIAFSLKAERPDLVVSASDFSHAACEVFSINAERLGLEVDLYETWLFQSLPGPFDMIVANPPYLSDSEAEQMKEAGWPEPQSALRAGDEGLDCIAQLIGESVHYLRDSGILLLEAAPHQMRAIRAMMEEMGFAEPTIVSDLAGRQRVASGVRNG